MFGRKTEIYGIASRTYRHQPGKGWVPLTHPKPYRRRLMITLAIVGLLILALYL